MRDGMFGGRYAGLQQGQLLPACSMRACSLLPACAPVSEVKRLWLARPCRPASSSSRSGGVSRDKGDQVRLVFHWGCAVGGCAGFCRVEPHVPLRCCSKTQPKLRAVLRVVRHHKECGEGFESVCR